MRQAQSKEKAIALAKADAERRAGLVALGFLLLPLALLLLIGP